MRSITTGACVFAVALLRSLADGFGLHDEAWFLHVVARVRAGEILYRDVAYSPTPLAVYFATLLTHVGGVEILIVKIATNAAFAVGLVFFDRLVRRARVSSIGSWILMGVIVLWARPFSNPPYTPLAMALFIATLATILTTIGWRTFGREDGADWPLGFALAGVCAGLSFAAKQNVGLLALMAAASGVLVMKGGRDRGVRPCVWPWTLLGAGFVAAAVLTLTPVVVTGGLPALWQFGFAGKSAYINLGDVSYSASLADWLGGVRLLPAPAPVSDFAHGLVLVLPVVVALAAVWRRHQIDRAECVLLIFAVAAVATAFPRWDRFHMGYAVPVHLITLMSVLRGNQKSADRTIPFAAAPHTVGWLPSLVAVGLFTALVAPSLYAFAGATGRRPSTLPYFRGPLISEDVERQLADSSRALAVASGGRPTFILGTDAGFWYLETGITNPTPFDMPDGAALGTAGVVKLLDDLLSGRLTQVCLEHHDPTRGNLIVVEGFVRDRMEQGPDAGPCTLYRSSDERNARSGR